MASATLSADAARARYKEGVGSVLDLLTAQAALASARSEQVQARQAWYTALAQLSHDTGLLDERGQSGLRLVPDSTHEDSK
jgi:outer membrane protein TolC